MLGLELTHMSKRDTWSQNLQVFFLGLFGLQLLVIESESRWVNQWVNEDQFNEKKQKKKQS